ncbi:lipoyl(octanoyl) transferase LipB [Leucobacter triazinivorans]|uniref:Octanoyltransferase n=1 Tax=Leucobacter triazinivorans TaxID=1784719 RepID=A0A4P6KD75_9MICO|nr:lipoyl(octanoyl) transferase LipB [Leucobacter triazinivorans]QBE47861.1 lipoyl(octanoyl) transferase LipB [Leucobacter triazinivorans]
MSPTLTDVLAVAAAQAVRAAQAQEAAEAIHAVDAAAADATTTPSRARTVPFVTAGLAPDLVPYPRGLELQREAVQRIRDGVDRGTVLLLEHAPVYTAGKRALAEEYPRDGTPVVPVDRGGKVTWHGPGQLVVYPVIRLRERLRVVDFVRLLERVIIGTAAEFGVAGFRIPGRAGVWAEAGGPSPAKFAQIGIHTSSGIVTHGLAVNCSNDLAPFESFVPCGITDAGVTTLGELAGRPITPADIAPSLSALLSTALDEAAE